MTDDPQVPAPVSAGPDPDTRASITTPDPSGPAGGSASPPLPEAPPSDTDGSNRSGSDPDEGSGDQRSGFFRAVAPEGPWQMALAVLAICFLAGAVGYLIGTRQSPVPTSAVDQGFLIDMSDHHDQAVSMALCAVNKAEDPVVQSMAREILVLQNRELAIMGSLLDQMRVERPSYDGRMAMAWMGMPSPVESMPGMASASEYDSLCSATATDVDRRFLTLMRAHHKGGVHMSEAAAASAANPQVRALAQTMARNQAIEVNEYTSVLKRLGYES